MEQGSKSIGVREVAAHANVSVGTVSRVINNHSNVKASTIAVVRQSMRELGYEPERVGTSTPKSATPSKKAKSICLCIGGKTPEWRQHPHINDCIAGVEAACRQIGRAHV